MFLLFYPIMYGVRGIPGEITKDHLNIATSKSEGGLVYHREMVDDMVEKNIFTDINDILICPIEPLNLPKKLTSSLLIEFEKPLVIGPGSKKRIYLTFPVEIGVFIPSDRSAMPLDMFTFTKQKFTLYGDVKTGSICKYWKSDIHNKPPRSDPAYEGVIELYLLNPGKRWVEVTKTVLNAYMMKIYYDASMVSMRARMKIISEDISETSFIDKPLRKGMRASKEVYTTQIKQTLTGQKFIMEGGI